MTRPLSAMTFALLLATIQTSAQPADNITVGYFDLFKIKAAHPKSKSAEDTKTRSEAILRKQVETGNKKLQDAEKAGKSKAEIEAIAQQIQTEVHAQQQALGQFVKAQANAAITELAGVINKIASDKNLDVVIDAGAVYSGRQDVKDKGIDITPNIAQAITISSTETPSNDKAQPYPVTAGFFSKIVVVDKVPRINAADKFRAEAEATLKKETEEGNVALKAASGKKTTEELKAMAAEFQAKLNAHQKELIQQNQKIALESRQELEKAVQEAAAKRGIGLVVENTGVFKGPEKFASNDLTNDIVEILAKQEKVSETKTPASPETKPPNTAETDAPAASGKNPAPTPKTAPAASQTKEPTSNTAKEATPATPAPNN